MVVSIFCFIPSFPANNQQVLGGIRAEAGGWHIADCVSKAYDVEGQKKVINDHLISIVVYVSIFPLMMINVLPKNIVALHWGSQMIWVFLKIGDSL